MMKEPTPFTATTGASPVAAGGTVIAVTGTLLNVHPPNPAALHAAT